MMATAEYQFQKTFVITEEMKNDFDTFGYIIVRGLLSRDEVEHIIKNIQDANYEEHTYGVADGEGKEAHIILWNHPGNDATGMLCRSEKIAGTCAKLLGGEVYHYHSKLMKKPPKIGGKHVWHQDYGYWYKNGCLKPDMMTVFIAIDECKRENGCLQILERSHKCGRIEHTLVAGQTGADMQRVQQIWDNNFPHKFVELNSGDALFFHCNLLHSSSENTSDKRRWALLCAYNRADNNPVIEHHHPKYTLLEKVADSAILECKSLDVTGKDFAELEKDKTSVATKVESN
ncbi:hypothetical protein CHS0354_037650 [Potamilus streckersoni]|uniref:Uncharacterized protein n=1 Tax=Potamilus streckersoni TaxID=2493646 RepID=A0AAE0W8Q6_9BIVA|nr:hypothetical protein CHS0354_037650 [Potamilus streckersoni]